MNRCLLGLATLGLHFAAWGQAIGGELIVNGGFESGFSGWTVTNQLFGSGS
jgi:hypothetical protein